MFALLTQNWWVVALRGLFALLFGVAALVWSGATLATLMLLFGGYTIADGLLALLGLLDRQPAARGWLLALQAIVSIAAGALALAWPWLPALALIYLIAAWAALIGISTIVTAIELRKSIDDEWLLGLSGVAALLIGLGMAAYPGAGALALLSVVAAYAIIAGLMQIALGMRLRSLHAAQQPVERRV